MDFNIHSPTPRHLFKIIKKSAFEKQNTLHLQNLTFYPGCVCKPKFLSCRNFYLQIVNFAFE